MLRNQVFTDFNLELKRELFNPKVLQIYDLIIRFIKENSKYKLEFWKSIWLKTICTENKDQILLLILINPKYPYIDELNKLANLLKINSFYYQFRKDKRKPEKLENLFLLEGKYTIYELIDNYKFHISPYSFCQSNNNFANLMYTQISNILKEESKKYKKVVIYGRTSSPISILSHSFFDKIYCSIPCPIVYQNMLLDLKENNIINVETIYQNKKSFNPTYDFNLFDQQYLLFLSPGYQGLPKNILNYVTNLNNINILLLYCNSKALEKDKRYLNSISNSNLTISKLYIIENLIEVCKILKID